MKSAATEIGFHTHTRPAVTNVTRVSIKQNTHTAVDRLCQSVCVCVCATETGQQC